MCFEGDVDFVKPKCNTIPTKTGPKVSYDTNKGCPHDRGYYGHCVRDGGEYIPFEYDSPSVLATFTPKQKQMNEEIVHKGNEKDCLDHGGKWYK